MIGADASLETNVNTGPAFQRARRAYLLDAGAKGFAESQERVPVDTGQLQQSGQPPQERQDGVVEWGYVADYAADVERGTPPHLAPFDAIRGWARRVIGSEAAAGPVWRSIAKHGTDPQPFVEPGADAMRAWLRATPFSQYLAREL